MGMNREIPEALPSLAATAILAIVILAGCTAPKPPPDHLPMFLPPVARSLQLGMSTQEFTKAYPGTNVQTTGPRAKVATVPAEKDGDLVRINSGVFVDDRLTKFVLIEMYMTSKPDRSNYLRLQEGLSQECLKEMGKPEKSASHFDTNIQENLTSAAWRMNGAVTMLTTGEGSKLGNSGDTVGVVTLMSAKLYDEIQK